MTSSATQRIWINTNNSLGLQINIIVHVGQWYSSYFLSQGKSKVNAIIFLSFATFKIEI